MVKDMKKKIKGKSINANVSILRKLIEEIQQEKAKSVPNIKGEKYVNLFFSFDIVNSTRYKSNHRENWAKDLNNILSLIISRFEHKNEGYDFWRTIGDEIIYTKKIYCSEALFSTVNDIYSELIEINTRNVNTQSNDVLSIKATAWIASISKDEKDTDNIYTTYRVGNAPEQIDYIGPDIDAGFRISKYSAKNRLALSFELAYILKRLSKDSEEKDLFVKNLKLMTFAKLKGVWNERMYPIIWYDKNEKKDFEDSFEYDCTVEEGVVREYFQNINRDNHNFERHIFENVSSTMEKIYKDNNLENKIKQMIDIINTNPVIKNNEIIQLSPLELHCAVVCYKKEEGKTKFYFIKRKKTESWEFGCIKLNKNRTTLESIKDGYHKAFGIELNISMELNYEKEVPEVISLYELEEGEGIYNKGLIFLGEIKSHEFVINQKGKYDEFEIVAEEEIEEFCKEKKVVDGFNITLDKCLKIINERR